jgi:pimeloyl-ACP methyl ester carboxylesterase
MGPAPGLWNLAKEFASSEGRIRYDISGQGPPLVLVHGTPWSSFNWRHLIPALALSYTVYYYDLIGYGQSEKRAGQNVSLGAQNQILGELLDHWDLKAPMVAGHDFGGTTVLRAHLLDRRDFEKMALIDPVALSPWGSPFFEQMRLHGNVFAELPGTIHEAVVVAYVRGATHRPMDEATLAGIVQPWLGADGQAAFYRQIAQADQRYTGEIEPRYPEINRPVLLLWGEQDRWIPPARGHQLHEAIPTSQFHLIPDAGHLVQEDAPALLVAHLLHFLAAG